MLFLLLACGSPQERRPESSANDTATIVVLDSSDSEPPKDTGTPPIETGDSVPLEETGDSVPPPPPCGTLLGATVVGGVGWEGAVASAVTSDGARYAAFYFREGSLTLDAGGPNETTLTPLGTADSALVRFDASGGIEWVRQLASAEWAGIQAVAVTSDGGAAIVGTFEGRIHFSYGEVGHLQMANDGASDAYVARFGADGALAWARHLGGEDDEYATDVGVLSDDTIVLSGIQYGDTSVAEGEPDETLLEMPTGAIAAGSVVAFDGAGAFLWAEQQLGTEYAYSVAIAADPVTDEIVTGGMVTDEATFGSDQPSEATIMASAYAGFVARYDSAGTFLRVEQLDQASVNDLRIAPDGGVLVVGDFSGEAILGGRRALVTSAYQEAFVARYDATDALLWAGQSHSPRETNTVARALESDGTGGLVMVGDFTDVVTFGTETATETTMVTRGWYDLFAVRYDAGGAVVCGAQVGGSAYDVATGVTRLPDGTYEVIDAFIGSAQAGDTIVESAGNTDVLYARYAF